jgi:hypothetical protein
MTDSYNEIFIEALVNEAESVWRVVSLAGVDDADVCDHQLVARHPFRCSTECDVCLCGRAGRDTGRSVFRGCSHHLRVGHDTLLAIVNNSAQKYVNLK